MHHRTKKKKKEKIPRSFISYFEFVLLESKDIQSYIEIQKKKKKYEYVK